MRIVQVQPHRITRYRTVTYYHPGTISNNQHFILSFKDEAIWTAEESEQNIPLTVGTNLCTWVDKFLFLIGSVDCLLQRPAVVSVEKIGGARTFLFKNVHEGRWSTLIHSTYSTNLSQIDSHRPLSKFHGQRTTITLIGIIVIHHFIKPISSHFK